MNYQSSTFLLYLWSYTTNIWLYFFISTDGIHRAPKMKKKQLCFFLSTLFHFFSAVKIRKVDHVFISFYSFFVSAESVTNTRSTSENERPMGHPVCNVHAQYLNHSLVNTTHPVTHYPTPCHPFTIQIKLFAIFGLFVVTYF